MENENVINTNKGIKSFFENNWLSLLLIVGAAVAFYFGYQRMSELQATNEQMNDLLETHSTTLEERERQITELTASYNQQQKDLAAAREDYNDRIEALRIEFRRDISDINRRRDARRAEISSTPGGIANEFDRVFGSGGSR